MCLLFSGRPSGTVTGGSSNAVPMIRWARTCNTDAHPQSCSLTCQSIGRNWQHSWVAVAIRDKVVVPSTARAEHTLLYYVAQLSCDCLDGLPLSSSTNRQTNRQTYAQRLNQHCCRKAALKHCPGTYTSSMQMQKRSRNMAYTTWAPDRRPCLQRVSSFPGSPTRSLQSYTPAAMTAHVPPAILTANLQAAKAFGRHDGWLCAMAKCAGEKTAQGVSLARLLSENRDYRHNNINFLSCQKDASCGTDLGAVFEL